jgi:two-component system, chemotaxis family, chemotaxis protein CheY
LSQIYIVDDDPIHHRIAGLLFTRYSSHTRLKSFLHAGPALDDLAESFEEPSDLPDIILLDLQMPKINGWDFLDIFNNLQQRLSKKIEVYIISTSIDANDMERSGDYSFVKGFYSKPLTPEIVGKLGGPVQQVF